MTKFNENNILETAMTITSKKDAEQYLEKYILFIQKNIDKDPKRVNDNAEEIAKSNLGYFAGYYSNEVRKKIEELFGCSHPFFGSVKDNGIPTAKEAFEIGKKLGTKHLRKRKINKINENTKK